MRRRKNAPESHLADRELQDQGEFHLLKIFSLRAEKTCLVDNVSRYAKLSELCSNYNKNSKNVGQFDSEHLKFNQICHITILYHTKQPPHDVARQWASATKV
jgi:hypothetical protein